MSIHSFPDHHKKEMAESHSLAIFLIFLLSFTTNHFSNSVTSKPMEVVDKVCNQASNYTFYVDSLYSDSRTPDAYLYTLAFISFGLAYTNASNTQDYIAELLKNASSSSSHDQDERPLRQRLQRCSHDYEKALSALEVAYNDLNSETFFELAGLAGDAARAADDCQAAIEGIPSSSPLATRNHDLEALCEIGAIIGKLLTGDL